MNNLSPEIPISSLIAFSLIVYVETLVKQRHSARYERGTYYGHLAQWKTPPTGQGMTHAGSSPAMTTTKGSIMATKPVPPKQMPRPATYPRSPAKNPSKKK